MYITPSNLDHSDYSQASFAGQPLAGDQEEPVGIITIEDVIEEVR